jgi:hypothetical protein
MIDKTELDESEKTEAAEIQKSFQRELNLHGYGFQFSVLQRAQNEAEFGQSRWRFSVAEFPVQVQGAGTRIDFVLFRQPAPWSRTVMIAECKRATRKFSNWCFIRTRYTHKGQRGRGSPLILETAILSQSDDLRVYANTDSYSTDVYHVAMPITSRAKGDDKPVGQYRSQIEEAATQVLRGVNGYVEFLSANPQLMSDPTGQQDAIVRFLPVVFTTASLWVSDSDLATAELSNGEIDLSKGKFDRVPWLWFQYNVSPGLKHSRQPLEKKEKVEDLMQEEYIRSIAVVNPVGISDFLEHSTDFLSS